MPRIGGSRATLPVVRIGIKPGQYGWTWEELTRSWEAAEEAGFDHVACFDHLTASPRGFRAWEAPSLLTAMAARTSRIRLSVRVINASLRSPALLAAQLAVAQAASGGRVDVGLGAGSWGLARFDHLAAGIPFPGFDERMDRLEALCRVLPALWRGDEVEDRGLGLRRASLGDLGIHPPRLVVGGASDRVVDIAVRHADGWDGPGEDPDRYAEVAGRTRARAEAVGRQEPLTLEAQVFLGDVGIQALRGHLRRLGDAGAERATVVLHRERGPDWVWRVADAVL